MNRIGTPEDVSNIVTFLCSNNGSFTNLKQNSKIGIDLDDHVYYHQGTGVPSIDIIDFDFPEWHTVDDTIENCSPKGLFIVCLLYTSPSPRDS